jgi:hemolysin activation/secretion protein
VDWTSEITGSGFGGDFDYRRHIISARYRKGLSPHQDFGVRAIGGWSDGFLPPQRLFGLGGIGSVHGYEFKQVVGDSIRLANLEYALGWRDGLKGFGFFDIGRVSGTDEWLKGVGFGIGVWDFRIDFGYRLDAVPSSLQVTLRFGRTF